MPKKYVKNTGDGQNQSQENPVEVHGSTGANAQTPPNRTLGIRVAAINLLSRRQVAQRWGVCQHTIARRNDLHPLRFNRRLIRYRLEEIEAVEAALLSFQSGGAI